MSTWLLKLDAVGALSKRSFEIRSEEQLGERLAELRALGEGSGILLHDTGDFLTFGIRRDLAFCHFAPADRGSDYRFATSGPAVAVPPITFNVGGTATEIDAHRCISASLLDLVLRHYFRTRTLPDLVSWEIDVA